jgi:hypothetical protein
LYQHSIKNTVLSLFTINSKTEMLSTFIFFSYLNMSNELLSPAGSLLFNRLTDLTNQQWLLIRGE